MNSLSLLLIGTGALVEVLGVLYCVVNAGDGGLNIPLLFAILAFGTLVTISGVVWHVLCKRI